MYVYAIGAQAYGFVELFAGAGWASKCVKNSGVPTASMDIQYKLDVDPKHENCMDLCTDSGFGLLGFASGHCV